MTGSPALRLGGFVPLVQVFDMRRSIEFYVDVLGLELVSQSAAGDEFDWCLLKRDSTRLMLNAAHEADERPDAPDPARIAAHADTTFFFACDDPAEAHAYLSARGARPSAPVVTSYGMKQVYVSDPDGYVLCFQCEATAQQAVDPGGA
jgi:catechol 2,3-dioxygenase-like lactoylglutathione lyase family enzyme